MRATKCWRDRTLRADGLRCCGCSGRKREHLVELGVNEFDSDLNGGQAVVTREINRALGVLKVVSFERVGGPVAQAAHE